MTACGGGDNATNSATPPNTANNAASSTNNDQGLKDYSQQLSTILTGVDQTRQYLAQFRLVANTALNDIKNLNPPTTVKDLYDRFVSALEDLLAVDTPISSDVQSINTAAAMTAYFDSHLTDFTAKTDLVNSVCSELQTQANTKNLGVDLKCSGAANTAPTPAGARPVP
jgi:hypothetical protein